MSGLWRHAPGHRAEHRTRGDQSGGTHLVVPTTLARAARKRKPPPPAPPAPALFACSSISWPNWVMCCPALSFSLSLSLSPSSNFPNYAPSIITSCDTSLTNVDGIGAVPMTLTMITMSATMTTMMTTMLMMMMTMVSLQGETTHPTQQMTRQSTANPWAQALQAGDAAAAARKN